MTAWNVTVNGAGQQALQTFREAAAQVAAAARRGDDWDVRVRGPRDSAFRYLTYGEQTKLVAAVRDALTGETAGA